MPHNPTNVNQNHKKSSRMVLAMLIGRSGCLDRVRDQIDPTWAHPDHENYYRALLDLPQGVDSPLESVPQDIAVQIVEVVSDVSELPATIDTALKWLKTSWAEAEMSKAWATGDPAVVAEAYQRTQANPCTSQPDQWDRAKSLFPRRPVPWGYLPGSLSASLQQLARSCATPPTALPGAAMCILASIVGRNVSISPKSSWSEPLILWAGDIRRSGQGKTPPARKLSEIITQKWQVQATEQYEHAKAVYETIPKKEREGMPEPDPPHSYYLTSLTMEGIRDQMVGHPTGGLVAIQDELSAMIAGQNEYKARGGSDREAWLCLHDGHPARIARAGKIPITITGARVQVYGGIQPEIFRQAFGGNGGTYLHDGTLYRFLLTFDKDQFHELTAESWAAAYQQQWEDLLDRARQWTTAQDDRLQLILGQDSQAWFLEWANQLKAMMPDLPGVLQGYIPKAIGYALRLAGILHLMGCFDAGAEPRQMLGVKDIEAGIRFAEFFLGQAVDAMRYLTVDRHHTPLDTTERDRTLIRVLNGIRPDVDNGRLAVSYVRDRFNEVCKPEQKIRSPHAMGAWLRSWGLNISNGLHDANQKKRVKCLLWDDKLTEIVSEVSVVSQPKDNGCFEGETLERQSLGCLGQSDGCETSETLVNESLASGATVNQELRDKRDNRDNFHTDDKKQGIEI